MSALEILGVRTDASVEEIRAAYLRKVKEFPPEQSPEEFEKIRDAYDELRDPRSRAKALLTAGDSTAPLAFLADGLAAKRLFAGPKLWHEVLKSK